jgi:hypothetical protein
MCSPCCRAAASHSPGSYQYTPGGCCQAGSGTQSLQGTAWVAYTAAAVAVVVFEMLSEEVGLTLAVSERVNIAYILIY